MTELWDAVAQALPALGPGLVADLVRRLCAGTAAGLLLRGVPSELQAEASRLLDAVGAGGADAAAYALGAAAGYAQRADEVSISTVWSGPTSHAVPVRATTGVLRDLIRDARQELLLTTYSARAYPQLIEELAAAASRGVRISVVVETLQGAGSALSGSEPADAFAGIPGVDLWHWPLDQRDEPGARMHAKLAVADQCVLLVTSANLTQSGAVANLEAGLRVRGGQVPRRVVEHVRALQARGVLVRL